VEFAAELQNIEGDFLQVWKKRGNHANCMDRLTSVIAELEQARDSAVARFASQANMPVPDFLRHFRVVLENPAHDEENVSFRVEPIDR
jgi:hypothetical protein